ncbi:MAG: PQQ-binding-like beta-propeller repeat protein [Agriterribacter sp.]
MAMLGPRTVTFLALILIVAGCQKNPDDLPNNNNDSTDGNTGNADYGIAYFTTFGKNLVAYDLSKEKFLWTSPLTTASFGGGFQGGDLIYNDGRIYHSGLYSAAAVDASTGKPLWVAGFANESFQRQNASGDGPVIVDSFLYCTSYLNSGDHGLYAINTTSGKIIWQINLSNGLSYPGRRYIRPIIHQDKIYGIAQDDSHGESNIFCCNRFNGNVIWSLRYEYGYATRGSLIKDDSLLIVGCEGNTYLSAYNLNTGKNEWTFNIKGSSTFSAGEMFLKNNKLYATDYWKQNLFVVDIPSQTATELPYIDEAKTNKYPDDMYFMSADNIFRFDIAKQQVAWNWESPLKAFNDSTRASSDYNYMYERFVVGDKYVYSQVGVFPILREDSLKIVLSVDILDNTSGELVKKLDLPKTFDNIWTNMFTINRDGKGY